MALKTEVWQDGWTAINSTGQWVKIDRDAMAPKAQEFIDAMVSLAMDKKAEEGSQLVFWWDKGEVSTRSWASAGAILYRLTCIGTPPSGTV